MDFILKMIKRCSYFSNSNQLIESVLVVLDMFFKLMKNNYEFF